MNVIISDTYQESCLQAANQMRDLIVQFPAAKLVLATGSTPVPIYKKLIDMGKAGEVSFSKVRTVNLDEYVGLAPDHPQSYRYFMDHNLFNHIDIDKKNTFVASGLGDLQANATELEKKALEGGPIQLLLLGIGPNGHIAFNEAGDALVAESHVVSLTESTIQANARFFQGPKEVPTQAITMGMKTILSAQKILLVATGQSKAPAISGLLRDGRITTQNPATFLKLHADVTVLIDRDLADSAKNHQ